MLRDPTGTAFGSLKSGTRSRLTVLLQAKRVFLGLKAWASPFFLLRYWTFSSNAPMRQRVGQGAGVETLVLTRYCLSSFTETGSGLVSAAFWASYYPCAGCWQTMMATTMICIVVVGTVSLGCQGLGAAGGGWTAARVGGVWSPLR